MTTRKHQKFVKAVAREVGLSYREVNMIREVLAEPSGSGLPLGPVWVRDLAARAKVRPSVASCVVEWFMRNPQQQGRIDVSWLADIKQDIRMTLWDVLSRSQLLLPGLNVDDSGPCCIVSWRDGDAEEVVIRYLSGLLGPLRHFREWPNRLTTSQGEEFVLYNRLSHAAAWVRMRSIDANRSMPWDPSAVRPGDSFVSTS
jgi:hypothetical protein